MDGGDKKKIWVIANWKSNKTIREALEWVAKVGPQIPKKEDLKVVVCPTFSSLSEVKKEIQVGDYPLMVGSQDLSPFSEGAYTGEESASLLKELVGLSILGHSERRENFSENFEMVSKKVEQALANSIIPLVCVQSEETPVPPGCKLIAYEPIFAIGTGVPDTPENAQSIAKSIKGIYKELEILYGGSVTVENVRNFTDQPDIEGVLIGNASLDADEFLKIIKVLEG